MTAVSNEQLQAILEAAIMVAGRPLTIAAMQNLFPEDAKPTKEVIKTALSEIKSYYKERGIVLHEVASGYRFQAKAEYSQWLSKLWEERAPRYSRAFLETLSIIAYKQPITRAEIEEIRGVTVSSHIVKALQEREWVRVIGYREVPGKPAIYGTTKQFLDYFNLKSLSDLPTLQAFKDIETQDKQLQVQLAMENSNIGPSDSEIIPGEHEATIAEETDNVIDFDEHHPEHTQTAAKTEEDEEEAATG